MFKKTAPGGERSVEYGSVRLLLLQAEHDEHDEDGDACCAGGPVVPSLVEEFEPVLAALVASTLLLASDAVEPVGLNQAGGDSVDDPAGYRRQEPEYDDDEPGHSDLLSKPTIIHIFFICQHS